MLNSVSSSESVTEIANRLQVKVRDELNDSIETLDNSRRQAKDNNDDKMAIQYASKIQEILDKIDEMSEIGLVSLDKDEKTKSVVNNLQNITQQLEKTATEMKTASDKLEKASQVINTASSFISKISTLMT